MTSKFTGGMESNHEATGDMHSHFSRIAPRYHYLRTTDLEPIGFMVRELNKLPYIKAVDIGCGVGRYDRVLYQHLGEKLNLTCVDANANMLEALQKNLIEDSIQNFTSIQAGAENLPLQDNSCDCLFTFNAIHHFNLPGFIRESGRVLKSGGYLFIYTRLRDQNKRNIWGRYFPKFHQKETRLYTLNKVLVAIATVPGMWLESIEYFKYGRISSLTQLVERVRSHHYSTFFLYSADDLEKAIEQFKKNINKACEDIHKVRWYDENTLFIIRKEKETADDSE
ncbi:MAG: class I SAM-dependent methyltransferase [Chloroflexota bacterium]